MTTYTRDELATLIEQHAHIHQRVLESVSSVVVGQTHVAQRLLVGLLTGGHVLLEGMPGLAKTLSVSALAGSLHATFSRVQFTPDLLPADLVGTLIYNPRDHEFSTRKGPIFANIVLADEINRAPAKVQSALLEAMQERQVTIGDTSHKLPDPFLVLATMNPVEQEGTYRLPEAQIDRFMLKVKVDYPSREEELEIAMKMAHTTPMKPVEPVVEVSEIVTARKLVDAVNIDARIAAYATDLTRATRDPRSVGVEAAHLIDFGASPRASINLLLAAKALAFLAGRSYVTPTDVKSAAPDVLRHRVAPSYQALAEGIDAEQIVAQVINHVPVP
ncbi:MAG: AAA family ATPase [Phycisphaeraceae bacterium]|nr:AAA family ATPase [Phycisphaerales bacterium]MCB9860459.1 AAA family ATPase [Phycisphaeraceae bacterium]